MDAATTVAIFAFAGTVVTAIAGAVVAVFANRSEKKQTAYATLEKAWEQRVILRDEQIIELKADLAEALKDRDRYKLIADTIRLEEQERTSDY